MQDRIVTACKYTVATDEGKISVSPRAEARLKERAAANGLEVAGYAAELLEQAVGEPAREDVPSDQLTIEEWSAQFETFLRGMREHGKSLPPGHVVDDSRETIYAGRGE